MPFFITIKEVVEGHQKPSDQYMFRQKIQQVLFGLVIIGKIARRKRYSMKSSQFGEQ